MRALLAIVKKEGALPAGLACDAYAYDVWFKTKTHEALLDTNSNHSSRTGCGIAQTPESVPC